MFHYSHKRFASSIFIVIFVTGTMLLTSSGVAKATNYDVYMLQTLINTDLCMAPSGASGSSGTTMITWKCYKDAPFQRWIFELQNDGSYRLRNVSTNKCLDVPYASQEAGVIIQQWECGSQRNQRWIVSGSGFNKIVSASSGKCLDVRGGSKSPGTPIIQWYCGSYQENQQWETLRPETGQYMVIVDNTDAWPSFIPIGPAAGWHSGPQCKPLAGETFWGDNFIYTQNGTNESENQASWSFSPPGYYLGEYDAFVYIPSCYASTTRATYTLFDNSGSSLKYITINQNATYGWQYLGKQVCMSSCAVQLSDATGEKYMSTYIGVDAVKWVFRSYCEPRTYGPPKCD